MVCGGSGGAAKLARVASRDGVVAVGAEHPHELTDHLALAELHDGRSCDLGGGVLDDREVTIAQGGDLGQMGYAEHLPVFRQLAQPCADGTRGVAAEFL